MFICLKEVNKKLTIKNSWATHPWQRQKMCKYSIKKAGSHTVALSKYCTNKINYRHKKLTMSDVEYGYSFGSSSPGSDLTWGYQTAPPVTRSTRSPPCVSGPCCGLTNNKWLRLVNGNKAGGYNLAVWNCRKGLIDTNGEASLKLEDIKQFIIKRRLDMLGIIESDLHGRMSRQRRGYTVTRNKICSILGIPGYRIYLPATWKQHGQARLVVYAREELKVNEKILEASLTDLPM